MPTLTMLVLVLALAAPAGAVPPAQPAAPVLAADHHGLYTGNAIEWTSVLRLGDGASAGGWVPFAVPLPAGVEVGLDASVSSLVEVDGQVVGLVLGDGRRELSLHVRQPLPAGEGQLLSPPLVAADAPQRVAVDGLSYTADPVLGLEKRLLHTVSPVLGPKQRRHLDRTFDGGLSSAGSRVYLVVDERLVDAGGLVGEVHPEGQLAGGVIVGVGGAFLLMLGAGLAGHRLLEVQARRERLDAYLRDELVQAELRPRDGTPRSGPLLPG